MKNVHIASAALVWSLASGGSALAQQSALIAADTSGPTRTVVYSALDLTRTAGAKALIARIKLAARAICGPEPTLANLGASAAYQACVAESMGAAVQRVNAPLVSAIYNQGAVRTQTAHR